MELSTTSGYGFISRTVSDLEALSLVEPATVAPGSDKPQALKDAVDTAQHAENLGYHRIWCAEHHDTASSAAQAPEILIARVVELRSLIQVIGARKCRPTR
ncbi:LLM class flavin-dependent oxidoreductase [Streptomyces sp. NBC_01537]|uniref:LLM class flavin-dependent oxidoreductase n=1 Tax=Streptomyces sp. NBC_01537 TaxID=2903896 RepID=UPI0038692547